MEAQFVLVGSDEGSVTALPPDMVRRAIVVFPSMARRSVIPDTTAGEALALPIRGRRASAWRTSSRRTVTLCARVSRRECSRLTQINGRENRFQRP